MDRGAFDDIWSDFRFAKRALTRAPGLTAGITLTLALGVGVNVAILSLLDVVLLRPPSGVIEADRISRVWTQLPSQSGEGWWSGFSYPQFAAMQQALGEQYATSIYEYPAAVRLGPAGHETEARVSYAAASYFDLLGVSPAVGRFFTSDEDRLGTPGMVAVVSHDFWRTQLGGESSAVGRPIIVGGRHFTLIGVASERFAGVELDATDVWLPLASRGRAGSTWWLSNRVNGFQMLLGTRDPGLVPMGLEQRLTRAMRAPEARVRPSDTTRAIRVTSLLRSQGPSDLSGEIRIATRILGITGVVLIIACLNVAAILLARAVRRRQEVAIRLALGISRARLIRMFVLESVLLGLLAGSMALLVGYWGAGFLRALLLPDVAWSMASVSLHWRSILLAAAIGVAAGLAAGSVPAVQSMRVEFVAALKNQEIRTGSRRFGARSVLLAAQVALTVVLLVGAGLLVTSLRNVTGIRTGLDARQVLLGTVDFDSRDSLRDALHPQMVRHVAERLRDAPGIEKVAIARTAPTGAFSEIPFFPDVDTTVFKKAAARFNVVSPEYFTATGLRILQGTAFAPGDRSSATVLINEAMARAQWPGMEALGRCIRFSPGGECYRVAGIVETAMLDSLLEAPQPQYYLPLDRPPAEVGDHAATLVVRAREGARDSVMRLVQTALRQSFAGGHATVTSLEAILAPHYRPWRHTASLVAAFGILALMVAIVGVYGNVTYTVAQQSREFSIRAALGARASDILRQVLLQTLATVAIGVALGVAMAIGLGRFVAGLLYGIQSSDPAIIAGVALVLLIVAAAAALGPASRLGRVSPARALSSQ